MKFSEATSTASSTRNDAANGRHCTSTCLRNCNTLHANYSLPDPKLRSLSPSPMVEIKSSKDYCSKNVNIVRNFSETYSDLPKSLADEELCAYFAMNSADKCKYEAFACRRTGHVKEDLILLAEEARHEESASSSGSDHGENVHSDSPIMCRLTDPVALTLNELQVLIRISCPYASLHLTESVRIQPAVGTKEKMAKLVGVCREDDSMNELANDQLPIYVEDMRTMIIQFEEPSRLFADSLNLPAMSASGKVCSRTLTYRQFCRKIAKHTEVAKLSDSLRVDQKSLNIVQSQCISCVDCRRGIEKLYGELLEMGHPALYPLVVHKDSSLTLHNSFLSDQSALFELLIVDGAKVKPVLELLTKCRRNKRCNLHSLDVHVPKLKTRWGDFWDLMSEDCRDECCVVETERLLEMLETYLEKHKFCAECRTKIMKAYHLLTGEADKTKESGYNPKLYEGLKYCSTEFHLHLKPCAEYLNMLMDRAEPELFGGFKERHAKTLDVAQGEVLTCLGLYLYDRLHRLSSAVRTMQNTFQLLYCTGVMAMNTVFQLDSRMSVSRPCTECCVDSSPPIPCHQFTFSRSLSPPADRPSLQTSVSVLSDVKRSHHFFVDDPRNEGSSSAFGLIYNLGLPLYASTFSPKVDGRVFLSSSPVTTDDAGYASSLSTHPLDHKSVVSSDALSISSDRSEMDLQSENFGTSEYKLSSKNIQCPSLVEMLNESRACKDDGIDSFDETEDGYGITKEDIEWFNKNRSKILRERLRLREYFVEKFKDMQIRLAAQLD